MSALLPPPGAEASATSNTLLQEIRARIERNGGCIPFDEYMEAALYEPGLGYYSSGLMPFGERGDFITAPESGGLFAGCLAQCIASVLESLEHGIVMELGAGSGVLAADLLTTLQNIDALPERYYILERSTAMRAMQTETLHRRLPEISTRVQWLEALPVKPFSGVIFGNEVADALPVKRFRWNEGYVRELGAGWEHGKLSECECSGSSNLEAYVCQLAQEGQWEGNYTSEYCPTLPAWINSISACLERGLLLMIDYGYGRSEYYHPQRSMGTLLCHHRHTAHADPFVHPGLQDITAFVDFTAIAEAAGDSGMYLEGYTSQAQFLVACGIDRLMIETDPDDTQHFLKLSNEAKRLVLPGEMGERFKVIGFSREFDKGVKGFSSPDLRSRL